MLQNETLLVFVSPVPTRVIRLQIYKVEFLFHVVELLVRNGVVLLSLFFNARYDYLANTTLHKRNSLKSWVPLISLLISSAIQKAFLL